MSAEARAAREGWGWPGAAGKAHYFRDSRSLCGRWFFPSDQLDQDTGPSRDDCTGCRRALDKEHRP